jgi:hypothetical protein
MLIQRNMHKGVAKGRANDVLLYFSCLGGNGFRPD